MAYKERNDYYATESLKDITNHLAEAMGMRGNADSNHMTNLNKMAVLEGNAADNREKKDTWNALQALKPNMSPEDYYTAALALRGKGYNREQARTAAALRPDLVSKGGYEAAQAKQDMEKGNLINSLAQRLVSGGVPAYAKQVGRPDENITIQRQGYSPDQMEGLARVYRTLTGGTVGKNYDFSGQTKDRITDAQVNTETAKGRMYNYRAKGYKDVAAEDVKYLQQKTAEVLNRMELKGKLNETEIKVLEEKILIEWNKGFQAAKTAKKRRELLDKKIDTEVENLKTQKKKTLYEGKKVATQDERRKKVKAERKQEELILKELPNKLKIEYEGLQKKNANLDATLKKIQAQESDALSRVALNQHKRMKVQVEKDIARFLSKNKDELNKAKIEVEKKKAGNWGTKTYNLLKYPNTREKKGTSTTTSSDSSSLIPLGEDGSPEVAPPAAGGADMSKVATLMPPPPPKVDIAKEAGEIISSLKGQNIRNWSPDQLAEYVRRVVTQSGGKVDEKMAMTILQSAMGPGSLF